MARDKPHQNVATPGGATELEAQDARSGSISGRVIVVLALSLVLAIAVMTWVLVAFYTPLSTN